MKKKSIFILSLFIMCIIFFSTSMSIQKMIADANGEFKEVNIRNPIELYSLQIKLNNACKKETKDDKRVGSVYKVKTSRFGSVEYYMITSSTITKLVYDSRDNVSSRKVFSIDEKEFNSIRYVITKLFARLEQ